MDNSGLGGHEADWGTFDDHAYLASPPVVSSATQPAQPARMMFYEQVPLDLPWIEQVALYLPWNVVLSSPS